MRGYPYVVRGAKIICTFGSHIRRIDMPVCHGSYIRNKPMLNELDCVVGLDANVPSFGACVSPENPNMEIIIENPEGVMPLPDGNDGFYMPSMPITGRLCTPMLGAKWVNAHNDTLIDDVPALTTYSTIACKYAGVICFIDDGQMDPRDDLADRENEQRLPDSVKRAEEHERAKKRREESIEAQREEDEKQQRAEKYKHTMMLQEGLSWVAGGKFLKAGAKAAKGSKKAIQIGNKIAEKRREVFEQGKEKGKEVIEKGKNFAGNVAKGTDEARNYDPILKHDPRRGWGSPNPIPNEKVGRELLDSAYSSSDKKQLYNLYEGQLIKFQPDGTGRWHPYEMDNTAKEIPANVLKEMRKDGKITNAEFNKYRKNK